MEQLTKKKCVPCEGIGRALTSEEIRLRLDEIPGWILTSEDKNIELSLTLKNFVACVDLINKIKGIAEDEMHHPDLHLTGYRNLRVVLYTHALGGVTENDLIVAAKINEIGKN